MSIVPLATKRSNPTHPARGAVGAFTLVEVMVAAAVLVILLLMVVQIVGTTSDMMGTSNAHQEADSRARLLLGRMAHDFGGMLQRPDVDAYFKSPANPQPGNDQIAFYSEVPGYYPAGATPGSLSLVAYRVSPTADGFGNVERMGKGLAWLNDGSGAAPVVYLPLTIAQTWPTATNSAADDDYEELSTGVFRLEYYYLLRDGTVSDTPWNVAAGHTEVDGFRDVSAIVVVVAAMDPAVRARISPQEVTDLAEAMEDFSDEMEGGELKRRWQEVLNGSALAARADGGIRIHSRTFALDSRKP